jgi:hypothetical protein
MPTGGGSVMIWAILQPGIRPDILGFIPSFLNDADPRPAAEQFNANYKFGGWRPFDGFTLLSGDILKYPGDPPIRPLAMTILRDEEIFFYEHAWVMIKQKDGSWQVSRMD